ncbi:enediyne antibiotic chromoprotein [Streptomyces sp. TLI_146]|uniref:enediyne antibiotic chromoprotein n=1 Tax=Streptomyces sp. TLI_146 TaxID=1938858 RepID=UPI000C703D48|nr:enediyne antibiotic chromoprotein [Streptomyces sp. TLI_146]PKV85187.1 neocarzinostatin family protein [Streptomyces sp. TLI_146]
MKDLITRSRIAKLAASGAAVAATVLLATPASAATAISVTPSSGLSDGQTVTVSGSGYTPGAAVNVGECASATLCSNDVKFLTADANGAISTTLAVKKTFVAKDWSTGQDVTVDCAAAGTQCNVTAWEQTTGNTVQNISFN